MATISENMGELGISISNQQIAAVERMVVHWELYRTHPMTLDGPFLGIDPISFKTADYNALFDIFHVHQKDVEQKIKNTPSINPTWAVTSDPFNLLTMWIVHLAPMFIKHRNVCHAFQHNLLKYMMYKFFCSIVNNSYRHGAVPGVMHATIGKLSLKSDIIRYESWKRLISAHVDKMLDPQDRFYKTIVDGYPDEKFLRVIAENQSSLRAKIKSVTQAYYEAHSAGDAVKSVSSVAENAEGEKIIAQSASVVESAIAGMVSEILNPNMFVHDISVRGIVNHSSNISVSMLRNALLRINETAVLQAAQRTFDKVETTKEGKLYIGVRILVIEIIRSVTRTAAIQRINMGNRAELLKRLSDAYRSSRNTDPDIIAVKRSVAHLVDPMNITTNTASQSALRLAVINYIIYRTLMKFKV